MSDRIALPAAPLPVLGFFDDYGDTPGHHPDLILGLGRVEAEPVFCPRSFHAGAPDPRVALHPVDPAKLDAATTRTNLLRVEATMPTLGVDVLVNLFLDENIEALPARAPMVHVLHRPNELRHRIENEGSSLRPEQLGDLLRVDGRPEVVVVHTTRALTQATELFPDHTVTQLGWPSASAEDVRRRFEVACPVGRPYVVLIGEARAYKQVRWLIEALGPNLRLHVAGMLHEGDREWLRRRSWTRDVRFEPGWVPPERMAELILGASAAVFPYWDRFEDHGGVSAALVQALTFGKPVVATRVIADQIPPSAARTVVDDQDLPGLTEALARVVDERVQQHDDAKDLLDHVLATHTYEGHVDALRELASTIELHPIDQ
jgi:glycosyltransferase involved in cell wall biosynthesis